MKITLSKDGKRLLLQKHFSDEELLTAECLDMTVKDKGKVVVDIRITCKAALLKFAKYVDRNLMDNPYNEDKKKVFVDTIRNLYITDAKEFVAKYSPATLYSDVGDGKKKLKPYQAEALWAFRNRQFNLCAFEQGLGKTLFAASLTKIFKLKRTLIICPSLTKWNWYTDLTEDWGFNPLFFTLLDRDKSMFSVMSESFVIVNYESIVKYYEHIVKADVNHIIIDEAHYVKNSSTNKYKNVSKLIKKFPKARVTFLTGTPIKNRITDVFALLKLSGHPMGKNFVEFKRRYARGNGQKITGVKNVPDFRLKLSNWILRKKAEEELDLPELRIKRYFFEMNDESTKKYQELVREMYEAQKEATELGIELEQLKADLATPGMEGMTMKRSRLVYVRNAKKKATMKSRGNIMTLNRVCSESKIPSVIKLVKSLNDQGEKVIVFSFFKTVLNQLKDQLGNSAVLIDGSVSSMKRRNRIDKFKKKTDVTVFLGQVIAAGIGINLVNARKVIFMDMGFTPDLLEQPYKRAHRMGQTRDVEVMYTMIPDSIDERIYRLIEGKTDDINSAIDHKKAGVVQYGSLEKKLFKSLILDYEKKNSIAKTITNRFEKV
jgi:SWI/SNF-related matrix-associated actin-dependent regulator of chromatin subfamily A-like protein 1